MHSNLIIPENYESVLDIKDTEIAIKKIKDYFEKIFVITHNPLVSNWSDNIVKIEKRDNVSRVVQ